MIDGEDNYLGAVNLKTLVKARSPKLIEEIMIQIPSVEDELPITEAIYDMKNYELYVLPVVDEENKLVGILTLDDVLEQLINDYDEIYNRMSFLRSHDDAFTGVQRSFKRLPW